MRSPDTLQHRRTPVLPLFWMALWQLLGGRALWTLLLLMCPLVGYSYFQAVSLYGEASVAAQQSPILATGLSPLDGVLVPSFGAAYVAITLLFPFVAIRALGNEKETGAIRLLVQLPYRVTTLIGVKFAAVLVAWVLASIPMLSALVLWKASGGHLSAPETSNLVFGHLLYGSLIGAIALFAASIADSAATAAIIALAFTIGSWVLDFTLAGQPGLLEWIARLSLTQVLRPFEQALLSASTVLGALAAIFGFLGLASVWVPLGTSTRTKLLRSGVCVAITAFLVFGLAQVRNSNDLSEDRRNSFSLADERALATLPEQLVITVHLTIEDPRYVDLRRNVLAKLERIMPNVSIRLASGRQLFGTPSDDHYGEIEIVSGTRSDITRSTSPREILPIIYGLAGVAPPAAISGSEYAGYPLIANAVVALVWFLCGLPLLIAAAWWWSRRPPSVHRFTLKEVSS